MYVVTVQPCVCVHVGLPFIFYGWGFLFLILMTICGHNKHESATIFYLLSQNQVYECELWDNKVIDLTGIGKYGGVKKSINLVRCQEIEPDNYTSTRFTVQILGGYSHELQASTENDRTSWIDCICDLCGICKL